MISDALWMVRRGGWWDQALLEDLLPDLKHHEGVLPDDVTEAVVVAPCRHVTPHEVNEAIAPLERVVLFLGGDEEWSFQVDKVSHPNMVLWVQDPHPGMRFERAYPVGYAPQVPPLIPREMPEKDLRFFFAGQVNKHNPRRMGMFQQLTRIASDDDRLYPTPSFTKSFDGRGHEGYVEHLLRAKIAPCPSGPVIPDTFRLYEALECGAVPITDENMGGFWRTLYGETIPFPVISDWSQFQGVVVESVLSEWPASANRAGAWWQEYKRHLRSIVDYDLGISHGTITVLIPTSPVPSNPDTSHIEETLQSVEDQLPDAEILVMIDGVRPEQESRRQAYEEYVQRLLWLIRSKDHVTPLREHAHQHQSGLTRRALEFVETPLILFVEHDTPLTGDIPWEMLSEWCMEYSGLVRLSHEARILDEHEHLMGNFLDGLPLRKTTQWSQRPHLASTDYYRRIISEHFHESDRWMVEDRMASVMEEIRRKNLWEHHPLVIYVPEGNIQRSYHLDARGDDEKFVDR